MPGGTTAVFRNEKVHFASRFTILPVAGTVVLVVAASASVGAANAVALVYRVAAVAIWPNDSVSPTPLPSAPTVVEVKVTLPLLPITLAVTVPLPKSPETAVAAMTLPPPSLPPERRSRSG